MKYRFSFFFAVLSAICLTSCTQEEEVLTGSISGIVTDFANANTPIAGATVTLNTKGLSKTTGSDGRYEFRNLDGGTYTIQAVANNYQATTKQVTVFAKQNVICDISLSKSSTNVSITPVNLVFGKNVEQLSFTIANNSNQTLGYSISNTPDFVEVSPMSGSVVAKGKQAISVHVKNRSSITTNRNGQITVNVGNDSYVVNISVSNSVNTDQNNDPNQGGGEDPNQGNTDEVAVTRGLLAYYTFDNNNANNAYRNSNNGAITGSPTFVTSTPNGKGKALSLDSRQYVTIPNNLLSGKRAYSICMWVKDFGTGVLFGTSQGYYCSPSIVVSGENKVKYWYCSSNSRSFSYDISNYQSSGWHMITVTSNDSDNQHVLYVDGKRVDTYANDAESIGNKMTIGGPIDETWTDPMIVDNVRIHSVSLSDAEVLQIYNAEKQ